MVTALELTQKRKPQVHTHKLPHLLLMQSEEHEDKAQFLCLLSGSSEKPQVWGSCTKYAHSADTSSERLLGNEGH